MPTPTEALTHKIMSRLTRCVEVEAERREVHQMDFAEVFVDRLVVKVLAEIETEPTK